MTKSRFPLTRRRLLATSAAATAAFAMPNIARGQSQSIPVGVLHPVTGFLSYSGTQCREGALMAIEDINAAGGIASMGGAQLDPVLADAQSAADVGAAEVERLNEAGVAAIIGAYASSICLATTQAAARVGIPHLVDVGVSDQIVQRGLTNTFRFGPGYGTIANFAVDNLVAINEAAGSPARTVMIIHEESLFGTGTANLLSERLPERGFEVLDVISHANPTRDFTNIVLQIRARNPDIVIPANYYNEYVLLARAMQQQGVRPKGIYSVLGGAASSYRFVEEFPDAAQYIMDCNHWFDPSSQGALDLKARVEARDLYFTYELFLAYECVMLLADAMERAGSADREAIIESLSASTWDGHFMPYGPTAFVDGQNQGAQPVNTQVLDGDIQVIFPQEFASAEAVFPAPQGG